LDPLFLIAQVLLFKTHQALAVRAGAFCDPSISKIPVLQQQFQSPWMLGFPQLCRVRVSALLFRVKSLNMAQILPDKSHFILCPQAVLTPECRVPLSVPWSLFEQEDLSP
jgi:hypothetical protein